MARKLETDKTKVWLYEEQLATYPNFETPDLNELEMEEIKHLRKDSEILEVMPEDYHSIFEALRIKVGGYRSHTQKCMAFCKNNRCIKNKFIDVDKNNEIPRIKTGD